MRALANGESVTILRPGPVTRDAYGNHVPGTPTEIVVDGCGIAPRDSTGAGSNEVLQDAGGVRDTVISGLILYAPAGTDLRATDRVRVAGAVYDIEGQPGGFRSPLTGSTGPTVALLTLVTG